MNLAELKKYFEYEGYELQIKNFKNIDFRKSKYTNQIVLYQSSEDRGLLYKDYIEDILLALTYQGAILIPDFYKFRAHHNKVFMELLRDLNDSSKIKSLTSKCYGTCEDLVSDIENIELPFVVKPASGALSAGVHLVNKRSDVKKVVRKVSRSFHSIDFLKNRINKLIRKKYAPKSSHRKKFIVQEYIDNLDGDYKILIYNEKYFVLFRKVRKHDFRASGSGMFSYPETLPDGLLDFAKEVYDAFNVPFISIDVAFNNGIFYLLEFQFVSFGTFTLENAKFYFILENKKWTIRREDSILEKEVAKSISRFIKNNFE